MIEHEGEPTRREFMHLLGMGAAVLGGAVMLDHYGAPIIEALSPAQAINGPSDSALKPAVRVNPPPFVRLFNPWEPGETIYEIPNDQNFVVFRSDDGPWYQTSQYVDQVFTSFGIKGKMSIASVAQNLQANIDVGRELDAAGYEFINHSLTHSHYDDKNNAIEMEPADQLFEALLGYRPGTYAGPGLIGGPNITAEMIRLSKCATSTKVFIGDTDSPTRLRDEIIARAKSQIRNGSIIVFHAETASHLPTRQALPFIIEYTLGAGFIPVTLRTALHTRYNDDGTRKAQFPALRVQNVTGGLENNFWFDQPLQQQRQLAGLS